jgi:ubiquinone/menaquinone biosynthesis C-methylase UbiE
MREESEEMHMADASPDSGPSVAPYVMESPREGARLEAKTDPAASEQQLRATGLRRNMQALDVGCGTGAVTRVMASIAAPGRVVGVDNSVSRLEQARKLAGAGGLDMQFIEGDARRLPLPSSSFDYAWSRFLFEYLPEPERALAELVRVTRPGGIVVVADLDGQLERFYPLEGFVEADLLEALRLLGEANFDPWVGRKLYHWFYCANLRHISVRVLPYQVYAGGLPERDLTNWREKLHTAANYLIQRTGERERWERSRDALLAQIGRPGVFYYSSLIIVWGAVPTDQVIRGTHDSTHHK